MPATAYQPAPTFRRLRPIVLTLEAGSQVTTFGDMLVVAHPAYEPEVYDRHTGAQLAVGGFHPTSTDAPPVSATPVLALEPMEGERQTRRIPPVVSW